MSISIVNTYYSSGINTNQIITNSLNFSSGNSLYICIFIENTKLVPTIIISDTLNNTFKYNCSTSVSNPNNNNFSVFIFNADNIIGSINDILTFNFSSDVNSYISIIELNGTATKSLDKTSINSNNTSSNNANITLTTSQLNDFGLISVIAPYSSNQ